MTTFIKNNKSKIIILTLILFIFISLFFKSDEKNNFNIGIVKIEGTILDSEKITKQLDDFNDDGNIDAIIVRLNTPGGSVAPSQEIYEKVKQISTDNKKPIVASIASVAASGGYYVAIGADKIVANPGSITGSIGVIMSFPIAKDFMEKIGLKFETVKSGEFKDSGSPYRYPVKEDSLYFKSIVDDLHEQFVQEVAKQRSINLTKIYDYCDGRIFTGKEAYENQLIDTLGTFEDALNISMNLANISGEINLIYPEIEGSKLLRMFFEESKSWINSIDKMPMYLLNN